MYITKKERNASVQHISFRCAHSAAECAMKTPLNETWPPLNTVWSSFLLWGLRLKILFLHVDLRLCFWLRLWGFWIIFLHRLSVGCGFLIPSGKMLPPFSSIWLFSFGADNSGAVHPERTDNDNLFRQLRFYFSFRPAFSTSNSTDRNDGCGQNVQANTVYSVTHAAKDVACFYFGAFFGAHCVKSGSNLTCTILQSKSRSRRRTLQTSEQRRPHP